MADAPPLMGTAEIAARWDVHPETVRRMAVRGRFPGAFRVERRWRIPLADVLAYETEQRKGHE